MTTLIGRLSTLIGIIAAISPIHFGHADNPYKGSNQLEVKVNGLTVTHTHDWSLLSSMQRADDGVGIYKRFSELNPFGISYDISGIEILDYTNPDAGVVVLASPPLHALYVTNDGQYIIGHSTVKDYNESQLVVWDRGGTLLMNRHISRSSFCFTPTEYYALLATYPQDFESLEFFRGLTQMDYVWEIDGVVHVDVEGRGISTDLREIMRSARCAAPYAESMQESISTSIYWYAEDQEPTVIELDGTPYMVRVIGKDGKEMLYPFSPKHP